MENFPDQTTPGTPPEQSGSMQDPGEQSGSMQAQSETGYGINSNGVDMNADDARAENEGPSAEADKQYLGNYAAEAAAAEEEDMDAFPGWYKSGKEQIESFDPTEYKGTAVSENPANPPVIPKSPENPITANEPNTVIGQQPTPEEGIKEA